jgi:hypothetical protein
MANINGINEESRLYVQRYMDLKDQRKEWENEWEDIRDYILPRTGRFDEDTKPGENETGRYNKILDATASRALRVLAAGMQGGLTSPARPWFKLSLYDEDLLDIKPISEWLEKVQKRMYTLFSRSNFYNAIHRLYKEECGYGQAVVVVEEDDVDDARFVVLTCGEYYLVENERGMIDTMYRVLWMQARQMEQKFGKSVLPDDVKKQLEEDNGNPFAWFKVLHCIRPRKNLDASKLDNLNFPFESIYIAMQNDYPIVRESGYRESPLAAPRWETNTGDVYGRSPGHDVLPDTKMLMEETADYLKALQKQNDPPLKGTAGLKNEVSHLSATVTYTNDQMQNDALKPIYEVKPDIAAMVAARQDTRQQIREGLYNDLFLMLIEPTPNMTATEVAERHEEKLLMLGPVIERQFYELLTPIIERVYAIMGRKGMIPEPPPELTDAIQNDGRTQDMKIEYVSLLAQAQKLVATQSIRAVTAYITGMAEYKPEVLDKLNHDSAVDEYVEATGAPSVMINNEDTIKEIRDNREAQQAALAQQQREAQAMEAAKTMGDTSTEEGTALGDLKNTLEGA